MEAESYRDLCLLEEVSQAADVSQRTLAKKLGMAMGLTNLLLRRMAKKGYIKAINVRRNRLRYLLTPQGLAEKTRLTYEYFEYSLYLYRKVRQTLHENLAQIRAAGGEAIAVYGTGELAEVTYLTLREMGLSPAGVVDEDRAGGEFLGYPVIGPEDLPTLHFDCLIITSLEQGPDILRAVTRAGVSEKKILVLEQKGIRIRAVHSPPESSQTIPEVESPAQPLRVGT